MSYAQGPEKDTIETLQGVLEGICKFLAIAGLLLSVLGLSFLIFYVAAFTSPASNSPEQALKFVEMAAKALTFGAVAMYVGSAYLLWGEDWLGFVQVLVAGLLYFVPLWGPPVFAITRPGPVVSASFAAMQSAGLTMGVIGIAVLVADLVYRVQARLQQGVKVDQLKYGKGIKEEVDRKNVFLGKCWQLPYCRKFVRERCPIYHARRTCWREKVGCMCEEEVIKGAMENRVIPKDALSAARYIPQNNKLTFSQKVERCKQCVIYNEHQKHKYRALLPLILVGFGVFYAITRNQLLTSTKGVFQSISEIVGEATLRRTGSVTVPETFQEVLLICVLFVLMAYSLKLLEFLMFKLKV